MASPVRPQLLSSAVFSCHFTGGSLGPTTPLPSQRPVECACRSGSPEWGLEPVAAVLVKVLPWVIVGAGGLGAGKTSGAGTRGVSLNAAIGGRTGYSDTNRGESSNN